MMLKYFVEKETNQHIAVNPNSVMYVRDFPLGPKVVLHDGSYFILTETYLEVVARLNEV